LVASKIAPKLLRSVWLGFSQGVVVVTGSAGKSSTTKMLVAIARAHELTVFTNPTTANIAQGFYASIIEQGDWRGRVKADIAILEVDEAHVEPILQGVPPEFVAVLNVTDDQLDRFVDPGLVRSKLLQAALVAKQGLILNADDQNTLLLARDAGGRVAPTTYFGMADSVRQGKYLGFANTYLPELPRPDANAEVVEAEGKAYQLKVGSARVTVTLPNRGIHYAADAAAAIETARRMFGEKFDPQLAAETVTALPPVFARGEVTNIRGRAVELVLVQNPASFQLNLDALPEGLESVMVAIGRDVHDPSWLWTVDYRKLKQVQVVSGYNAHEMALCFAYNDVLTDFVSDDLETALEAFLATPEPASTMRTILLSADAMRRYRRMLGFIAPDMVGQS
jgi:UDP-N-acetylmuramyl pentapeptide synthase